ncbi:RICIN domain-containing protein [Streptomyces kanasensis]|uniref:RICIN domain-containing protein n=1 Tax=Streptomyces kanasensis TaxID=936756 RepID=UPI003809F29B
MRMYTRARRLLTVPTGLAVAGVLVLPAPAVAQPAPDSAARLAGNGAVQMIDVQTRKCATVAGGTSTENNVELVQFTCDTHPSRRWRLANWNGNSYQLVNVGTRKCMTVAGGVSRENNVQLVQFTCDTHPSRRWRVVNWNGSSYQVVNAGTRKCATVAGGTSTENNVRLVQFTCDTHPSRRWTLRIAG